jgi:hypothetical protein
MPSQSYALEKNGPKRLKLSWRGFWKDLTVTLDGKPIGAVPDRKALSAGQEFKLPDHSKLKVQLVSRAASTDLLVLRNGKPLPGSASDPLTRLKGATWMVYLIGGMDLVFGVVALAAGIPSLSEAGFGLGSVIYGLIFLLLGWLVSRRSRFSLILAIVLVLVEALTSMLLVSAKGSTPSVLGFMTRLVLMVPMVQGLQAIKTLSEQEDKGGKG